MQFAKRWLTAIAVAVPVILAVIFGSRAIFFGIMTLITLFCLYEYFSMFFKDRMVEIILGMVMGAALTSLFFLGHPLYLSAMIALTVIFSAIYFLFRAPDVNLGVSRVALFVLGVMYVGFLFPHLMWLRDFPQGKHWVIFTLLATFMGDTFAAYVGSYLGRRKLYPRISPGKTIEGSIGGLAGSTLAAIIYAFFFLRPALSLPAAGLLGLSIGCVGILGDLFESMLKRSAGIKDSGSMLPGHGGWLDRLDAVIFTVPFTYYAARICIHI